MRKMTRASFKHCSSIYHHSRMHLREKPTPLIHDLKTTFRFCGSEHKMEFRKAFEPPNSRSFLAWRSTWGCVEYYHEWGKKDARPNPFLSGYCFHSSLGMFPAATSRNHRPIQCICNRGRRITIMERSYVPMGTRNWNRPAVRSSTQ